MAAEYSYLKNVRQQFLHYKELAEKAMEQLEPAQLFFVSNNDSNSIASIIRHLRGNMLSRWTDFLTSDGEKPGRNRDAEFDHVVSTREQVLEDWEEGWACLFAAIDSLQESQLSTVIHIRNEPHTVMQALNRQLAHYPYHIGQIVYAAKQLKNSEWYSLSISKHRSDEFNGEKMGKKKPIDGLNW